MYQNRMSIIDYKLSTFVMEEISQQRDQQKECYRAFGREHILEKIAIR